MIVLPNGLFARDVIMFGISFYLTKREVSGSGGEG
jgi:hypothetical protein